MNHPEDLQTLVRPSGVRSQSGGDTDVRTDPAPDVASRQAQQAILRSRAMNEQVARLLGGLELEDARNLGGQ